MKVMSEAEIANARRVVVRHNLRAAAPYVVFMVISVACVLAIIMVNIKWGRQNDADFANAPLQKGTAFVSSKYFTYTKSGVFVTFQFIFRGRRLSTDDPGGLRTNLTNVGDAVAITYRVGKSGNCELVDWQAPARKISLTR